MVTNLALLVSIATNIGLALTLYFFRSKKPEKASLDKTYDVQMLLRDLSTGPAYIKMQYMDRDEMFLRSPRDMR